MKLTQTTQESAKPVFKWSPYVFMAAYITLIYWHGLFAGAPRADQLIYLYQVQFYDSFWGLLKDSAFWNRERGGDVILFRPILYYVLAFEWRVFGYDFFWWQATAVALHAVTSCLLFRFLTKFAPTLVAFAFTFLFASQFIGSEMVLWHHITGYLLFCAFGLAAILCFHNYIKFGRHLPWSILFAALAVFTYEGGLILVAVLCGVAAWQKKIKAALALGPIIAAYAVISAGDLLSRGWSPAINQSPESVWSAIWLAVVQLGAWLAELALPAMVQIRAGERLTLHGVNIQASTALFLNILLVLGIAASLCLLIRETSWRRSLLYALPGITILYAYSALIAVGRAVPRGLHYVLYDNLYYAYIATLIAAITMVMAISHGLRRNALFPVALLSISIFGLAILNGYRTTQISQALRYEYAKHRLDLIEAAQSGATVSCAANDILPWFQLPFQGEGAPTLLKVLFRERGAAMCPDP